ncbi:MAG: VanW family protein, partial [Oscillospiraceae bacterium]|nr:VanW family protein [Oscillospiraceae bacterium]
TGALSREAGEDPGTYAITQGTLTAGDNYEITFTSAVLTINKKDEPAPAPSGGGGGYYGGGTVQNQRRDAYSDVIGAAATNFRGSSPERIRNIELACEKLDGIVLQPGEVFSFNEAVGLRTAEAGFEVAPVDANDEATAEMGGGVSQVSSTLYASALLGLLETVERPNHSFPVSFIQPGTDALVTNPDDGGNAADLKFRNTRTEPIRISATCRVDEATQLREVLIEIRSALTASDYMPILFDNSWSGNRNGSIPVGAIEYSRPGYRILLTHEEQQFTDASGAGIRTLTHRKILDAAGMLVRDEILNSKLPDGSYAMDTYYQG